MCNNFHSFPLYHQHHHSLRMYFIDFLSISFSCIHLLPLSFSPTTISNHFHSWDWRAYKWHLKEDPQNRHRHHHKHLDVVGKMILILSLRRLTQTTKSICMSSFSLSFFCYPLKVIDTEKIRKLKSSLELACPLNRHAADKVRKFNSFLRWTLFILPKNSLP